MDHPIPSQGDYRGARDRFRIAQGGAPETKDSKERLDTHQGSRVSQETQAQQVLRTRSLHIEHPEWGFAPGNESDARGEAPKHVSQDSKAIRGQLSRGT